jgi:type VI secretion system protein
VAITLSISGNDPAVAGIRQEIRLDSGRLSIGRDAENDWVLPDPGRTVSRRHCIIEGTSDAFRLLDLSANGVFVNGASSPVGRNNGCVLGDGDCVRIGPYEITVVIGGKAQPETRADEAVNTGLGDCYTSVDDLFGNGSSPTDGLADRPRDKPFGRMPRGREVKRPPDLDSGPPIDAFFSPPYAAVRRADTPLDAAPSSIQGSDAAGAGGFAIPEDWDNLANPLDPSPSAPPEGRLSNGEDASLPRAPVPLGDDGVAEGAERPPLPSSSKPPLTPSAPKPRTDEPPISTRVENAAAANNADALVDAFLAGAAMDRTALKLDDPNVMLRRIGEIYRVVVEGVIGVLESRRAIKSGFRVGVTEFKAIENNPLKFSIGADDTMVTLLSDREKGYLPAETAFREAFEDIREHQIAVLAGMQEVWTHLIRRFDPTALEARLGEDSGIGSLFASKKARCWDAFKALFEVVAGEAGEEQKQRFEEVFSLAYQKHITQEQRARRPGEG